MKQKTTIYLLWISVLLVLPLFTVLGKILPPIERYQGGLIVTNNTWIVMGYVILIVLAPIVALATGTMLSLRKPRTKTNVIFGIVATIVCAFLVYYFTMIFGLFASSFLDKF